MTSIVQEHHTKFYVSPYTWFRTCACTHTHMKIYCVFIKMKVVLQHAMQGLRGGRGTALHTLDPNT
jgi:hypothetical protein